MIRRWQNHIEWLEFTLLQPFKEIVHAVFLRCVDFSNLHKQKELDEEICKLFALDSCVKSVQVHEDGILRVPHDLAFLQQGHDGIITQEKGVGLVICHADCQAAIFFDPKKQVIANVHCGWRGNVCNIYGKTVQYFVEQFASDPEHILVCISPSLGPQHAEFVNHEQELPKSFLPFQIRKNYFDFWQISQAQLRAAGILSQHIEIANLCTFALKEDFFSYRRDKKTERHGTIVALNFE